MRRPIPVALLVAGLGLSTAGCAHVEAPRGGPEDVTPPSVLSIEPESESIVPGFAGPVVIRFQERISELSVEDAVLVSPRTSPVNVDAGREEIRVSLREGWRPDVIYHVTVNTQLRDLFNNPISEPIRLVFSTGPTIPDTEVGGTVVDRITATHEADVRVEAIRSDSLVYAAATDSAGIFRFEQIPEGDYLVRAFQDVNSNRALDAYEARDSAEALVSVAAPVQVALSLIEPDSTAPVLASAALREGLIELEFDDYLDPDQQLDPGQVTITAPDGTAVAVARLAVGELPVDSVAVAPDSLVVPDTLALPPDSAAARDTLALPPDSAAALDAGANGPPRLPSRTLVIEPAADVELRAETEYAVTVSGVRNLLGLEGGGETTFVTPATPPEP